MPNPFQNRQPNIGGDVTFALRSVKRIKPSWITRAILRKQSAKSESFFRSAAANLAQSHWPLLLFDQLELWS